MLVALAKEPGAKETPESEVVFQTSFDGSTVFRSGLRFGVGGGKCTEEISEAFVNASRHERISASLTLSMTVPIITRGARPHEETPDRQRANSQ